MELPLRYIPVDKINDVQNIIRDRLLKDFNVYASHFPHNGRFYTHCSAQIWNEVRVMRSYVIAINSDLPSLQIGDFEYLGRAFLKICEDIEADLARAC